MKFEQIQLKTPVAPKSPKCLSSTKKVTKSTLQKLIFQGADFPEVKSANFHYFATNINVQNKQVYLN